MGNGAIIPLPIRSDEEPAEAAIILDVLAAVAYACHGLHERRKVVYWSAAAALTFVVTF